MIKNLGLFLSGDENKVIASLTRKMRTYSKDQKYEAATGIRNQLSLIEAIKHKRLSQADRDELTQSMIYASQLKSLKTLLKLKKLPRRIETYDIATLSGKHSTGSMVVFVNAKPSHADYRHFKIRSLQTPNDVAMMAEVVGRRIRHEEWPTPDLVIVDGGKPQVNQIKKTLTKRVSWQKVPVIGIAKRVEELIINNQIVRLPRTSPALKLIQHTRDEAHRFSRRLHKRLRQKHLLARPLKLRRLIAPDSKL